jgi:predicted RNA-binding protein with RPS1 domain
VKVLAIEAANQKASLSIKQLIEKPADAQAVSEADREQIEANSNKQNLTQNLGDLLREKLGKISE